MTKETHIIHLSDLHFGEDHGFLMPGGTVVPGKLERDVADVLIDDLQTQKLGKIIAVIVSGDLMTHARWVEYGGAAFEVLKKLCSRLGIAHEKLLIVPGNHDYEWYVKEQDKWTRTALRSGLAPPAAVTFGHVVHFESFLRQFYGSLTYSLPTVHTLACPEYVLKIGLLDSCKIVATKFHEYGYLSLGQIKALFQKFSERSHEKEVRAIVMHHHATSVIPAEPPPEETSVSVTLDAARLIDIALRDGITFLLHGHQHYPCITRINKSFRVGGVLNNFAEGDMYLLSGGSTGVKSERRMEQVPNTYSVITLQSDQALVKIREIFGDGSDGSTLLESSFPLQIRRA